MAEPGAAFGYIGVDGRYVIEPRFSAASEFDNGVARVEQPSQSRDSTEFGYIDRQGAFLWGPFPAARTTEGATERPN